MKKNNIYKGQMSMGTVVALVIALIVILVIVAIATDLGEKTKDTAPFDDAKVKAEDAMNDKRCAMECTASCIDKAYVISSECSSYVINCCDCDSVQDITDGCSY
ncbi:MAG: hypothetical protein GQ477_01855 [Nanohaloarchaea archaeon]|nr:hypothetical protein [Candidatus Nanohaloarchaea archaeon]